MSELQTDLRMSLEALVAGEATVEEALNDILNLPEVAQNRRYAEALGRAIETLAASRHLIGKYTPEHHWLAEHDARIAELKAFNPIGGSSNG